MCSSLSFPHFSLSVLFTQVAFYPYPPHHSFSLFNDLFLFLSLFTLLPHSYLGHLTFLNHFVSPYFAVCTHLCTFHLSLKLSRLSGLNTTDTTFTFTWHKQQAMVWGRWHSSIKIKYTQENRASIWVQNGFSPALPLQTSWALLYVVKYFLKGVKSLCKKSTTGVTHDIS